jgi:iron-sulfur cluster repair protein YtfE (RIC family)
MDAIQFLKQQHEQAKEMFGRLERAQAGERERLWRQLGPELRAHEQIEEQHLYGPVARDASDRDHTLAEWQQHHREEVHEAETLIQKIDETKASDQSWLAHVHELKSALEQHIEEEEGTIWPKIRQLWDAGRLEKAGKQMATSKRKTSRAA